MIALTAQETKKLDKWFLSLPYELIYSCDTSSGITLCICVSDGCLHIIKLIEGGGEIFVSEDSKWQIKY